MSKAEIKKKYNNILSKIKKNPSLCEEWKNSNGTMFADQKIEKPKATSPGSYNVIISKACETLGIIREDNTSSPPESHSVASKTLSKKEKMKAKTKQLFENPNVKAIVKLNTLIGVVNNQNDNPPYYSRAHIKEWVSKTIENNDDTVIYSPITKKYVNKYTPISYKHFFKILLYGIIYKISFNHEFFNDDKYEINEFRKLVKKVFKETKFNLSNFNTELYLNFGFLYYKTPDIVNGKKISKDTADIYIASIYDAYKYSLIFVTNIHPELKQKLYYEEMINSLEKDNSYQSLSNSKRSISSIDNSDPIEFQQQKYPCKYQYKFLETDNNMQQFAKDMIKTCNYYSLKDNVDIGVLEENVKNIRKLKSMISTYIYNHYKRVYNIVNYGDYILELTIDTRTPLKSLFDEYIRLRNEDNVNLFFFPISKFSIKRKSHDGIDYLAQDVGGVTKDVFNDITKELFQKKIFVKPDVKILQTKRYFLNPKFNLEDLKKEYQRDFKESCAKSTKGNKTSKSPTKSSSLSGGEYDEATTNQFYTFLGELIIFLFVNDFKLPYNLSSYLLSGFLKEHYTEKAGNHYLSTKYTDYIYYMMRDFDNAYNILIHQPLKIGMDISDIIDWDTFMNIQKPKNEFEINKDNYINYLSTLSSHIYESNNDDDRMMIYHICFFDAFGNKTIKIRKPMNIFNISLDTLDNELTQEVMTENIILKFVDSLDIILLYNHREVKDIDDKAIQLSNAIKNNFYKYILSLKDPITYTKNLLKFWTGIDEYNDTFNYKINIFPEMNSDQEKRKLPVSHTCFNTIDIPLYDDFKEFTDKLKTSIEYIQDADMAGGRIFSSKKKIISISATSKLLIRT